MAFFIDEHKLADRAAEKLSQNMSMYIDQIMNYKLFVLPIKTYLQIALTAFIGYYVIKSIKTLKEK